MDLGLDLNTDRNLKPGQIAGGSSARFERGSGIFTGPGYRLAANLATSASTYLYEGTIFPLLWAKSGTKVFHSADPDTGTAYDIGLTLTSAESGCFVQQSNGDIGYTNQTDTPVRIAVARNTVVIADTDVTITVGTDWIAKFANSGTVYVRGDAISYTGKNAGAGTLTGVTGIAAGGHPVNSIVTQTSNPSTWAEEKGSFAFEYQSRLVVGGRAKFEGVAYASVTETAAAPANFYDFDSAGTNSRVFSTKLVGGISGLGRAYLFGERQVHSLTDFDVTTGAFQTSPLSEHYGAYNPRCIVDMDGLVCFFGKKRLMPIPLTIGPSGAVPGFDENFDLPIRPWLEQLDDDTDQASSALLAYDNVQKVLKISGRRNGALETYVCDLQNRAFLPAENRPATSYAMFNGVQYWGSTDGKIHRDDTGRTNAGVAINHRWSTGRLEAGKNRPLMQLGRLSYQGSMTRGCEHRCKVYLDGSSTASYDQLFTDSLIVSSQGKPLGTRGVGSSPLGSDDTSDFVYRYENDILLTGLSCEDVRVEWVTTKEGVFFQTDSYQLSFDTTRFDQRTSQ